MSLTGSFLAEGVPNVAFEIVISTEQQPTAPGKGDGSDSTDDVVMRIDGHLLVGANVKQSTGGVV